MDRRNAIGTFIGGMLAGLFGIVGEKQVAAREVPMQEGKIEISLGYTTYYCDRGDGVFYLPEGTPGLTPENIVVGYQAWGDIDGEIRPHAFADVPPTPGDVFIEQHPKMLARVFACQIYFY